jgi:hypothetical protein
MNENHAIAFSKLRRKLLWQFLIVVTCMPVSMLFLREVINSELAFILIFVPFIAWALYVSSYYRCPKCNAPITSLEGWELFPAGCKTCGVSFEK